PSSGSSSRLISLSSVLLPAPLRPTSATTSPASTVSEKRSRTRGRSGRENETLRNSIAGSGIALATVPPEAEDMPQNSRERFANENLEQRDNQQIQDDNQTSGESVVAGQTSGDNRQPTDATGSPNYAADREPAEGGPDAAAGGGSQSTGGISNRPLSEEHDRQHNLPPRGEGKGDRDA